MTRPPIRHPGPVDPRRHAVAPAETVPLDFTLEPGQTLEAGLARFTAHCDSAYLDIETGPFAPFNFVMPAPSPDADHAAWYSTPINLPHATIDRAAAIVGRRDGAAFVHCHGLWHAPDGLPLMGHALPPECVAAAPTRVRGIGLRAAAFVARHDPETNFRLFAAEPLAVPATPAALLVTLRPNQDLTHALAAICVEAGIHAATIHGIGSLNGARFDDAPPMHAFASEFLVLESRSAPLRLHIAVVDPAGDIHRGWLVPGENPVCVTCELVIAAAAPQLSA